jgi:hypothetical protein
MVFILEKAESTMFCGLMEDKLGTRGSAKAAAETMQNRLNPSVPAASTVKGPLYSLILTLTTPLVKTHQLSLIKYSTIQNHFVTRL